MKQILLTICSLFLIISSSNAQYRTLGTWDSQGRPNYLLSPDTLSASFLDIVTASLPESHPVPSNHPEYLVSSAKANIVLTQACDVWVTFVTEGAGYRNVLGYYTYPVGNPPSTIADIQSTMTIIFPNTSLPGSGGNLPTGSKVKIGTFPANTVIGWFLVANGFTGSTTTIGSGNWLLFSNEKLNPEPDTTLRRHVVQLYDVMSKRIMLSFEDIRRDSGSDLDFNDAVFTVTANPIVAIDTTGIPKTTNPNANNYADLVVTKSVDNTVPGNNTEVNYTVKVVNNGPGNATNVKIADKLSKGLIYISSSASSGTYDTSNGIWTIPSIPNGQSKTLTVKAKVDIFSDIYDLGVAKVYNLFALGDVNQPSSDTEGKMAVAKDCNLSSYSVGYKLPNSAGADNTLVVGGILTYTSGAVYGGNIVYNKGTNLPINQVSVNNGTLIKDSIINFAGAESYLKSLSTTLNNYTTNGNKSQSYGELNLTGNNPLLNVFRITGAELTASNNFIINVPNGSVVLINVTGTQADWKGGHVVNGTAIGNVIYNFPEATYLKISQIDVRGTLLAPKADLDFPTGVINGQAIVKNVYGTGQFNNEPFLANIPIDPKIDNVASVVSLEQTDPELGNNEASVVVNVGATLGGNNNTQGWTPVTSFASNEIVWTLKNDAQNNLLSGTWGGVIYRSVDNGTTWNRINNDMSVGYIWALLPVNNNVIFAGTEKGLYKSTNNGTSWSLSTLSNKDIRALAIDNSGNIFAGTWGLGIYRSTDNGTTWTSLNVGATSTAIQGLTVAGDNTIYAATFGNGVIKSTDHGVNWQRVGLGYDYVWSVAVGQNNKIFAGTYGQGLFVSSDNGANWIQSQSTTAKHIYSISVGSNNNVYLCSWASGVFMSTDGGVSLSPIGLRGAGATTVLKNSINSTIYVGTTSGAIYATDSPLGINEAKTELVPAAFEVAQNYPNPFNPNTILSYSIPRDGYVSMKVYTITGEVIATLVNEVKVAGVYSVNFDASKLPSGVYIYRTVFENKSVSKKMLLTK